MTEEATRRFAALVNAADADEPSRLDEAALLIAAHARGPALAPDELDRFLAHYRARLDDLAAGCATNRLADVTHHVFVEHAFRGNTEDYYDPRNSYLDEVLDRRLGIPITLGVVLIEVARRAGLALAGVNTPGHFLVRLRTEPAIFVDPFSHGELVSPSGFDDEQLAPVGTLAIVARMLANLRQIHTVRHDGIALEWVVRLRSLLPGASLEQRSEQAGALAALARFDEAAAVLEDLAEEAPNARADALFAKARRLRARLN